MPLTEEVPAVSIGVPTYNRPELLALALENFRQQTFSDFEVIISDNASPNPEVRRVAEGFAKADHRFRYFRQPSNQGATANFWYVYGQARAPYFFWASDDDIWDSSFIERGVSALEANPNASGWFCQIVNIDGQGNVVRTYPSFSRFQSTRFKALDLAKYLLEREVMGKANLIYAIFRREAVLSLVEQFRDEPDVWGNDMSWVYSFLCRSNLMIDDTIVVRKRLPDGVEFDLAATERSIVSRESLREYLRVYRKAASGSGYERYTNIVLKIRFIRDYIVNMWWRGDIYRVRHGCIVAIKAVFRRWDARR